MTVGGATALAAGVYTTSLPAWISSWTPVRSKTSTIHIKPTYKSVQPCAKFNLLQIMRGRGLCNNEEGIQPELMRHVDADEKPPPPASDKGQEDSGGSTQSFAKVAEDVLRRNWS